MKAVEERDAIVLTPEHVPLRLCPAGLGARFFALLLDACIILALSSFVTIVFGLMSGFRMVAAFVVTWGYHVFFEVRFQGRSPGKRMCGLRVVDSRGLPVTFQQSFVRNIVRVVDSTPVFYGAGALVSLLDRWSRRLGDIVADTLVIEELAASDPTAAISGARRFNSLQNLRVLRRLRRQVGLEER